MRAERLLRRIEAGEVTNVRFDDLIRLAGRLGFELNRQSGSHHILRHPDLVEQLNLQEAAGKAKPYQVRQFRNLVLRYNLSLVANHERLPHQLVLQR